MAATVYPLTMLLRDCVGADSGAGVLSVPERRAEVERLGASRAWCSGATKRRYRRPFRLLLRGGVRSVNFHHWALLGREILALRCKNLHCSRRWVAISLPVFHEAKIQTIEGSIVALQVFRQRRVL